MKNTILIWLLLLFLANRGLGQTPFWIEDFGSPQGWYLEDNWVIANGKLEFYWSPAINNFDQEALSPLISLDNNVGDLIVTQYLDVFSGTPDESAEIAIISGNETTVIWDYTLLQGNWGISSGTDILFPLADFAGQDIRIRFRTYGLTTFNWNWWDVYEIKLTAFYDKDLAVHNISGPNSLEILETGTWQVEVKNLGVDPMSDYTVYIYDKKTGNQIGSIIETESLISQETRSYNFDWTSNVAFNTVFYGAVQSETDQFDGNNASQAQFVRIKPDIDFDVLVWDNDNGIQTVTCPEQGDAITPSTGLKRALASADISYDYYSYLPDNLDDYDMIFATMGCFCVD